jgi:hypothetical protein
MPGTIWRALRPILLMVLVVAIVFALFSVGVAIGTADKCGEHFNSSKDWNYFPPRWDCTVTTPGN